MAKTIVSIKEIFYADAIDSGTLTGAVVAAILLKTDTKKIANVHDTTWVYEEAEGSTTDYVNQMNAQVYYRDYTPGTTSVTFSVGQYEYQTKADLQGGTATATSWKRPELQELIYKCIIARTKDDTYIVFPKASITARGGMVEDKLIGLLLTAVPVETGVAGLVSEGWFDASEVV